MKPGVLQKEQSIRAAGGAGASGGYGGGGYQSGEFRKSRGEFRRGGGDYTKTLKQSENEDVIYGKDFDEEALSIEDIIGEMGEVVVRGKILKADSREIKNERTIVMFDITDFSDTIGVKLFTRNEFVKELMGALKPGAFVKLKGVVNRDKFDHDLTIGAVYGIKKIKDFTTTRMDTAPQDRKSVV